MRHRAVILLGAVLLLSTSVFAQNTDIESLSGLQFNFGNPGARSLGMGGAFLGLADDASAAEANPAGLTILRRPEVSLEGRNYETIAIVNTTGFYPDLVQEEFNAFSRAAEVNFASVVLPFGKGAISAYYHLPLAYESEINAAWETNIFNVARPRSLPNFFMPVTDPPGSSGPISEAECEALRDDTGDPFSCLQFQTFPYFSAVNIKLQTWGLAGAYQFGRLSLGAAYRYHQFEEAAITQRTDLQVRNLRTEVFQATVNSAGDIVKESDSTFVFGFKYAPSDRFSIGGAYKEGASFDTSIFLNDIAGGTGLSDLGGSTFHVPDVWGVGVSWRPMPVLTINVDGVNVSYGNLTDDFQSIYPEIQILGNNAYETEDATEVHVGAEYFFASTIPFALRAGWWRDPAHQMKYVGPQTCTDEAIDSSFRTLCAANRTVLGILFPGSEDDDHWSVGFGLAWPRFQVDAAYETSDRLKVGSLSGVFRF